MKPPERYFVGPVLQSGSTASAVIAAIKAQNPGAEVTSQGAYLRVRVPTECSVTREEIEAQLGREFRLPGDLEAIMSAFSGRIEIREDGVRWAVEAAAPRSQSLGPDRSQE